MDFLLSCDRPVITTESDGIWTGTWTQVFKVQVLSRVLYEHTVSYNLYTRTGQMKHTCETKTSEATTKGTFHRSNKMLLPDPAISPLPTAVSWLRSSKRPRRRQMGRPPRPERAGGREAISSEAKRRAEAAVAVLTQLSGGCSFPSSWCYQARPSLFQHNLRTKSWIQISEVPDRCSYIKAIFPF